MKNNRLDLGGGRFQLKEPQKMKKHRKLDLQKLVIIKTLLNFKL